MASWTSDNNVAPRWHAVLLVWLLGATVSVVAAWYGGKWWLG